MQSGIKMSQFSADHNYREKSKEKKMIQSCEVIHKLSKINQSPLRYKKLKQLKIVKTQEPTSNLLLKTIVKQQARRSSLIKNEHCFNHYLFKQKEGHIVKQTKMKRHTISVEEIEKLKQILEKRNRYEKCKTIVEKQENLSPVRYKFNVSLQFIPKNIEQIKNTNFLPKISKLNLQRLKGPQLQKRELKIKSFRNRKWQEERQKYLFKLSSAVKLQNFEDNDQQVKGWNQMQKQSYTRQQMEDTGFSTSHLTNNRQIYK